MTDKNEIEKEPVKETKSKKKKQEVEASHEIEAKQELDSEAVEEKVEGPVLETKIVEEKVTEKEAREAQLSSLDTLWHNAFNELDEWAKRGDFRDEVFLKEAMFFADNIQRNQGNIKALSEKFNKEFAEWERTAREEFLMSTTSLQHFFPLKSYEEINAQINQIQKRTMSILHKPFLKITNYQAMDKYLEIIDQYIAIRKKSRNQYIKTVKQAGNLIYENQKGFVNLFAKQIKTLMFPLNKYMEKAEELTKS
ncbi:hypothetical protein [Neobacillus sp. OS1-33]|uniref:hypothetical protein n=1 Tax=Neobacillus sp. OS1-33 TaxID=3070683 RepID=UPI0027E10F1B|nr:hypothetical protein [Neobacillus sp. OS1-33]WML27708.1 hypothetical protein RCG22_08870 [Neobacillus sp. OS1-33]